MNSEIDPSVGTEEKELTIVWVEYDLDQLTTDERFMGWPHFGTTTKQLDCESNCAQGMLPPRTAIDMDGAYNMDAAEILVAMQGQRLINQRYVAEA